MKCEDLVARLWAYFEGKLSDADREAVDEHAATCPSCGPLLKKCAEVTCRDFAEFLNDYVDDRLSPERKAIFERHLTVCEDCIAYLGAYRKTIALARAKDESNLEGVPPDLIRGILDAWSKTDE